MKSLSAFQSFGVLCWNVHKEMGEAAFERAFSHLLHEFDPHLLLLQEAVLEPHAMHLLEAYNLASVKNIDFTKNGYGVLSASRFELLCEVPLKTKSRELYCMTKKSLLITAHPLSGEEVIHVVNLHAINFVSHRVFLYELGRLEEYVQQIKTPLIVAGDFNTWSEKREKHVERFAATLGLERVEMEDAHHIKTQWKKPLDHILYRGVELVEARAIDTKNVSDHNPIWAEFRYNGAL